MMHIYEIKLVPQMTNLQRITRHITVNTTYMVATGFGLITKLPLDQLKNGKDNVININAYGNI
jgi:hypothetical protein